MVTTSTTSTTPKPSFEASSLNPRHDGSRVSLRGGYDWDTVRDSGIVPLHASALSDSQVNRDEFLVGAELLRFHGPRAQLDPFTKELKSPHPQQLLLSDALAMDPEYMGVLLARRSAKTSSLFAIALGRVASRQDYKVAYTMTTTAIKARQRFRQDITVHLDYLYPDKKTRPFTISLAGGSENIVWDNGSIFAIVAPKGESFRSDAWDLIIADEGGEADTDTTDDIEAGALATMDTRPGATFVAAGTAGDQRDGNLLWKTLEDGREGKPNTGILEYAAAPDTKVSDIRDNWPAARELVLAAHPGIGTLTTLERIESNFEKLKAKPETFLKEYLSIFAKTGAGSGLFDFPTWESLGDSGKIPTPPSHFRMAFAVHPLQTSASIMAVWRVGEKIHIVSLAHSTGVTWLYKRYLELCRKYKMPVVADSEMSVNQTEIEKLGRAKPKPRFELQKWNQVATAASTLLKEIEDGNVVHYNNPELNEAVRIAVKRGTKESKRWSFGRPKEEDDITPLEAAALALRAYDEAKPRVPLALITGNAA